jgi:hypothetical protein
MPYCIGMITKEDMNRTPSQLAELIAWREERSAFWTAFAKQTKRLTTQLQRLAFANEHAKKALNLNAELNGWSE